MLRYLVSGLVSLSVSTAWAQQTTPPAQTPKAAFSMANLAAGDYWTYVATDEITGKVNPSLTHTVTEVTPKDASLRISAAGSGNVFLLVIDRSLNVTSLGSWKYTPSDGAGIREPLTAGKTWTFQGNDVNSETGFSARRSGQSKVIGQESVTTKAGTFDAFKIETSYTLRNSKNPSGKLEGTMVVWYSPTINYWVKRATVIRIDGRLREKTSMELTEYGRKR